MFRRQFLAGVFLSAILLPSLVLGQAPAPAAYAAPKTAIDKIRDEGMNRSQVMSTAHELVDGIGARLSNSTSMRRAEDWAVAKMLGYGLSNVRKEGFEFGRGWFSPRQLLRSTDSRDAPLHAEEDPGEVVTGRRCDLVVLSSASAFRQPSRALCVCSIVLTRATTSPRGVTPPIGGE